MNKYIIIFLLLLSTTMTYLYIDSRNTIKSEIKKIEYLTNLSDSLNAELFPCEIELNRYRIAFELFVSRNPKAAEEYATIISQETE